MWVRCLTLPAAVLFVIGCAGKSPEPPPPAPPPPPPAKPAPPPAPPAPPAPEPPAASERELVPAELDPAVNAYLASQYAYLDATAKPVGRLVVYLVGARNSPDRGRAMGAWLASQGFHVLVPGYANDYDIRKLCEGSQDGNPDRVPIPSRDGAPAAKPPAPRRDPESDCHGKLRLEAFEGVDHSPHITIARPDSLEARVGKMLERLAKTEAAAGWSRFAARALPRWEQITVAGHSHGASSAALIGKVRRVERVVMLSGPFDNRGGNPADWIRRRSLTPADRLYGFTHAAEEQHPGHMKNWKGLGLAAPVVVLEKLPANAPLGGARQLVTSLAPEGVESAHGMTTGGKSSPRTADGSYRFAPVWRHLFGLPAGP